MSGLTDPAYLQSIIRSVYNGVIAINADQEVTLLNPSAERMLGL